MTIAEGFAYEPGVNAKNLSNTMEACIVHYTAGACGGDRQVGLNGYFHAYAPKSADCGPGRTQFAPIEAVTWSCCEWNPRVTSIEVELLNDSETMNDYQLESCGLWVKACIALGIAPTYTDTPNARIPVGGPISGFVSHRSLQEIQCDEHYDYWTQDEWTKILAYAQGPGPKPPGPKPIEVEGEPIVTSTTGKDGTIYSFVVGKNSHWYMNIYDPKKKTGTWVDLGGYVCQPGQLPAAAPA